MNRPSLGQLFEERANNFNLIRVLAALAVIYGHAGAITGQGPADFFLRSVGHKFIGGVAVDVFFVLSGFLITSSAMSQRGLTYYMTSRLLRIYPALIVCVLLSVFLLGPMLTKLDIGAYFHSRQTWAYLWQNMTAWKTQYELPGVFLTNHDHAINGSLWSLAVEIRLYVIVIVFLWAGLLTRRSLFNALFALAMAVSLARPEAWVPLIQYDNHRDVTLMFLIGAFMWVNRHDIPMNPAVAVLLLMLTSALHKTPHFGLAYTLALPYFVFVAAYVPGLTWFNRAGDYSYGIYLYGWPCQQLALMWWPTSSNLANTAQSSVMALSLAFFSWHLIEQPAMGLKKRLMRSNTVTPTTSDTEKSA